MIKFCKLNKDGNIVAIGHGPNIPNGYIEYSDAFVVQESQKYEESKLIKDIRSKLLFETDWTQLPDVPESTRLKWQEYRQALRDITLQEGFPENIIWPTKPE
jgi:hypothetical protein